VKELAKVTDITPGQVQRFMEHSMKTQTMLQHLNTILVKYRVHVVEVKGTYTDPMEQHRFPWAQTCEEMFISWSEYEKIHLFQAIS